MNGRSKYVVLAVMLLLSLVGCSANESQHLNDDGAEQRSESKPIIAATNFALESMANEIVGDFADVFRPRVGAVANGLGVEEVVAMQRSAVVLTNGPGANDAAWLDLISLNESRVHETTSDEFEASEFIQVEDFRTVHSHGDEGEHSHPWLVPHCWLNPRLGKAQSLSILNRFIETFPDQETAFRANHKLLTDDLGAVEELANAVSELLKTEDISVIASDPRLLFFTRSLQLEDNYLLWFDLPEAAVAIEELKNRKPDGGQKLLLLWAQESGALGDQLVKATSATMVNINLMEADGDGDYVDQLRSNYQSLKAVAGGMSH